MCFIVSDYIVVNYVSPLSPLWGRHIVFALSVGPSVRLSHFVSAQ